MSARVRAPLDALSEGIRVLDAAASHYLANVLRLRRGDALVVFDPEVRREADAVVALVDRGVVTLSLEPPREARVTALLAVTWVQGLAKGDKMDAIVRDATELGATRIVPAFTTFTAVKLDAAKSAAKVDRWERIAREAARQCGRGDAPEIVPPTPWAEALASVAGGDWPVARFCLYEREGSSLGPALERAMLQGSPLAFAAGPEGGLSGAEVREAEAAGWTIASLGAFVLRTETVAAAVLGAVRVLSG